MIRFSLLKTTKRQVLSCATCIICSFLQGCRYGWQEATTPMFLASESSFQVTKQDVTWIASATYCASTINVIICLLFTNNMSRKTLISFGAIVHCFSWIMLTITRSADMMKIAMLFAGVMASFTTVMSNIYFGEIASPKNREILSVLLNVVFGIGKGSLYALSLFDNYSLLCVFPLVMSIIGILFLFWMRESPCYLISKNSNDLAKSNLCWFRDENDYENVKHDYEEMEKYVEEQNKSGICGILKSFVEIQHMKIFFLYLILYGVGYINSTTLINVYGPEFVKGLESINGNVFMNTFSALQITSFMLSYGTIRKFSRRDLMFYGFIMIFIIHVLCGLGFFINENLEYIDFMAIIIAALLIINVMVQVLTVSAGLEVLRTEIFSYRIKEFCGFMMGTVGDFLSFVAVQIYFPIKDTYGDSANFIFYAACSLTGIICVYLFMTDTKDKTLMQIRIEHSSYGLFVHNNVGK